MQTATLKAFQLYDAKALLLGHRIWGTDKEGKQFDHIVIPGFVNEKSLNEGTKREAYKIGKILEDEITLINEQRKKIAEYTEDATEEVLKEIRAAKEKELLESEVKLAFEPISFTKVEHLTLTDNYQLLYDKFFN